MPALRSTLDPQERIVNDAEPEVRLQAVTYPNPVEEEFTVNIEGASGQHVRLWLVDVQGRNYRGSANSGGNEPA